MPPSKGGIMTVHCGVIREKIVDIKQNTMFLKFLLLSIVANNIYEKPSTEKMIKYLHDECGFPTLASWLAAIWYGIYVGWPSSMV